MRSYADMALAAVLPKRQPDGSITSHLDFVLNQRVDESYFTNQHRWLWKAAIDAALFDSGLDEDILRARMDEWKVSADDKQKCFLLYLDLQQLDVSKDKIKVILPQFKEEVHAERFADILESSAKILTEGKYTDNGQAEGYQDAKKYIIQCVSALEDRENRTLPTQEIRDGVPEFLEEYNKAKTSQDAGVKCGFHYMDSLTNGQQPGELFIMCGHTSNGKSQFLLNAAYNACVLEKRNVVFVSLEMPLHQVRRRLFVRHSNNTRFGLHEGLDYVRVKRGSLNIEEEKALYEVANDFVAGDYGRLDILQMAKTDTVESLRERLTYIRSRYRIDKVVLDYLSLLSPTRRRSNRQDEIIEVVESLKSLALNFNEGEGLPILTANQTSRKAYEEALEDGEYGVSFASDTSAIEKNADLLAWILRTPELEAAHEVRLGVAKYRDGASGLKFNLFERYASCLLDNLDDSGLSASI
jgi:replicative DNA helicase